MAEFSKEIIDNALEAIEVAKATGKIKKGTNEVTKAIEKGKAKLVVVAKDANPPEIVMHIPLLSKEKGISCVEVDSKEQLGASAGIDVPTASVAVVVEGDSKKLISQINEKLVPIEKPEEKPEDKSSEKDDDKTDKKTDDKADKKTDDKADKKTDDKEPEKAEEKSSDNKEETKKPKEEPKA
jgi:large subunit ribosomal protein L7Ae